MEMKKCSFCGREAGYHAKFCAACGKPFAAEKKKKCGCCGRDTGYFAKFCTHCGAPFAVEKLLTTFYPLDEKALAALAAKSQPEPAPKPEHSPTAC